MSLAYWLNINRTAPLPIIPNMGHQESIDSVTPDSGYRASIFVSFQMDPRYQLAGMTKNFVMSDIVYLASIVPVTPDSC